MRSIRPSRRLLLGLLAAPFLPLAAQQGRIDTLPEIVSTATRLPTPGSAVVATRTVISGDELRERGIRTVLDALRDVPGTAVTPSSAAYGAQTSLFLRGGNSDYVKVLVDGVALNQPGGLIDLANLTTDNLDRIEVVRGPASVLYGADAVTGVVQLFTRTGAGRARGELRLAGGTFGTSDLSAAAQGSAGGARWSLQAGRLASGGVYAFNNDYRNTHASGRLQLGGPRFDLALTGRLTDGRYEFPTNGSGIPADSNQVNTERSLALGADAGWRVSARSTLRLLAGVAAVRTGFRNRPDSPGDTLGYGYEATNRSDILRGTLDARLVARAAPGVDLVAGASIEREHEELENRARFNFGDGQQEAEPALFDQDRTTVAPYLQAVAQLPAGLAVNAGARLDDNSRFGAFGTFRVGAAWQSRSGTRLRASVGNAFKAPKFREQFIRTGFEIGNPELAPERSTTWELGVEQAILGSALSVSATWFDSRFRNLIQYRFVDAETPTYVNLARAAARGVELEVSGRPARGLQLGGAYTWLETEVLDAGASAGASFREGSPLLRRPKSSARLFASARLAGRLTLGTNVLLVGPRDDVDFDAFPAVRTRLEGYALTELTAEADVVRAAAGRPAVTALLRVENAFDARYEPVLRFPGRGRAVLTGVRVGL